LATAFSSFAAKETAMIKQLKFVGVPTRDQDRALAFWTGKMGFKVMTDQPMGPAGQRWIELGIPGAQTGITLFTPEGQEDRVGTFFNGSFACDDVDFTYRQLSDRGVEISAPDRQPWGSFCEFKDTDGNSFVLSSR
jgi:catechol 2,3-dioxygenase-like lactoylglutathione lyase family enzyme